MPQCLVITEAGNHQRWQSASEHLDRQVGTERLAGQPKRRAMVAELDRRAKLEHDGDVLAYAAEYIGNGGTVRGLAKDLSAALQIEVSRPMVSTHLNGLKEDASRTLSLAREDSAFAFMERAEETARLSPANRDDIALSKLKIDTDIRLAEAFNRRQFGQAKTAEVTVNIAQLMLHALEAPIPGLTAIPSAIVEDAIDVTIDEATT